MSSPTVHACHWDLLCPACGKEIGSVDVREASFDRACPHCSAAMMWRGDILDAIGPGHRPRVDRFVTEYGTVRRDEGRGSDDPAWYRNLPSVAEGDPLAWQWTIRARSWECLEHRILRSIPIGRGLDLGSGVGWLSARMAALGWNMLAVDLLDDDRDGLGAARHYGASGRPPFGRILAHFDAVPLADSQADLIIYNASLHYSSDYRETLREALRLLSPEGRIVVMDSPSYRESASGRAMVQDRRADFKRRFGFASDALDSREFLLEGELETLGGPLGLSWRRYSPRYGLAWRLRPLRYRLQGKGREPARFALWVGQREPERNAIISPYVG